MIQKNRFNRKILASVIASTALTGFSGMSFAQDVEEVLVTGIRASMERAMDTKRESAGVVDAISSEDIGKFPDTNLAESLQRITGVSISRNNGEGAEVTVRGFGAANNMVTLNGRTMPAAQTANGDGGGSRAFDFGNLASEGISGVQVYKTGKANITTGGIGATINVLTAKPLDTDGFKASVGVKAVHDTTNRFGDDVTPEASGLFSWSNDDSTFGIGLTMSHQQRDSAMTGAFVNGWTIAQWDEAAVAQNGLWQSQAGEIEIRNAPEDGQLYARPDDIRYEFSDTQRTRDNAQLTLQFAPTENFTATADYTFAENEVQTHLGQSGQWMQQNGFTKVVEFDNSAVATPIYIKEVYAPQARDEGFEQQWNETTNTLESFGANFKYQATDALSFELDVHDSEMHSRGTGPKDASGRASGQVRIALGAPTVVAREYSFGGKLPTYLNQYDDAVPGRGANQNGVVDAGDVGSTMFNIRNADQLSSVTQVKFDGKFEFAENARLDFGIESREMESHTVRYAAQDRALGNWDADYPGEFGDLVKPFDLHGEFDDFSPNRTNAYSFRANPVDLYEAILANPKGTNAYNGKSWDYTSFASLVMPQTLDDRVNEDMMAAYFQVELSGDVGNMPFSVLTGLRYETTDVTSTSLTAAYKTVWASDNDFSIQVDPTKPSSLKSAEASYDNLLPSLDLRLDIRDDLIARFSFGKTIARAGLGDLGVSASNFGAGGGSTVFGAQPTASQSNPALLPLESTNFDLSLEWYYDDASYVSAGVFEKNVMNFLGTEQINMPLLDIRNPADGPRAQQALADLETLGIAATDETLHNMMVFNQFIVQDGGGYSADWIKEFGSVGYNGSDAQNMWLQGGDARNIIGNDADAPYVFRTATPNNGREAKIHGAEFAIQHFFGDTGFGVLANYTIVRGDVAFDNLAAPGVSQFSLNGLSDTANLVGMYETDRFSARIAYNWRDKFINGGGRGTNNPLYVEDYSQIDINLSYDVTDAFSVSLEGINVTGEDSRTHGRISSHLMELRDLGPRYQVGARYTF